MASVTYFGHFPVTYPDYIDLATGKTLTCQPGQTYNVAPASGNIRSAGTTMPQDGRFITGQGRELTGPDQEDPPDEGDIGSGVVQEESVTLGEDA